ncbi:MAG: uroporphyrinogen decarboxylase [Candidatus Nanopelagicales bacterium]|nr:uroporphyrinogen decarboxylase [Candidatus Nanopelagicales bacterium]MDZ4250442.1 uroporphyrinogen decarboxylase [Candidatus Nanopelagicales bacterium]
MRGYSGLPSGHPIRTSTTDSPLIAAARGLAPIRTPVWFMRQAGRSLPEYRAARRGTDMLSACFNTDLVVEITMQPVRRYGVDAAILFSDIVVPLRAAGVDVDIREGVGPVLGEPFRHERDLERLGSLDAGAISRVTDAVAQLVRELDGTALIGFCGAPFTLASYMIEGGPSSGHHRTKALMWSRPRLWDALLSRMADLCGEFLRAQVLAGASAVQVFDSWAGALCRSDYVDRVLPHSRRLLAATADLGVPRIHFGVGTGELLSDMAVEECEVVGVDHRVDMADAVRRIGLGHSVQGNIDPALALAGGQMLKDATRRVLAQGACARGHILNLGHGVLPETDPARLAELVEWVHEQPTRRLPVAPLADTQPLAEHSAPSSGTVGS